MSSDDSGRRRMCADERRAQLLAVACRMIADQGYEATTTAVIAREAGVSEPVLYRHFDSKSDLFREILARSASDFLDHCERITSGLPTGAIRLLAIVDGFPGFCRERLGLLRLVDRALAEVRDEKTRTLLVDHYETYCELVSRQIEAGQQDGSIDVHVDARMCSWMLIMTGIGFSMLAGLERDELSGAAVATELRRRVAAMIAPQKG